MANLAPNTKNYAFGKGKVYFTPDGSSGRRHLGNVPTFNLNVSQEKSTHYSSMAGLKEKDLEVVIQNSANVEMVLEEFTPDNLALAFMGEVSSDNQAASVLDGVAVASVADRFVDLGGLDPFITRVVHGAVADGPYVVGDSVTGGTSAASGDVAWVGDGFLELVNVVGTFVAGEDISDGGGTPKTATVTGVSKKEDVVVADAATPTTRYVQGTDYDLDREGGMLRILSDGDASGTVYVWADLPSVEQKSIAAFEGSEAEGELLFVSTADQGPRNNVQAWNCRCTLNGNVPFISDEAAQISISVEILSDRANHPDEPFFKIIHRAMA